MDTKTGQQTDNSLKTLLDAVLLLSGNGDLKQAFHQSAALVAPLLGAKGLLLYTLAEQEEAVRGKLYAGSALRKGKWQEVESVSLTLQPSILFERQGEPAAFTGLPEQLSGYQTQGRLMAKPIAFGKAQRALLVLDLSKPDEAKWPEQEPLALSFAQALSGVLARHQAEEKVASQRNYLRKIIDHLPGLVFAKDAKGRFVMANKQVAEMYGVTIQELIGKTDADLNPHPEEVARYLDEDRQVIEGKITLRLAQDSFTTPKGEHIDLQTLKLPIASEDGESTNVLGIALDVSKWKGLEEKAAKNLLRYRNFVQHTGEGIYYVKCEPPIPADLMPEVQAHLYYERAIIEECNMAMAQMYGLPGPEALIGKRVLDFHLGDGFAYNWEVTRSFFQQNFQIKGFETQEQASDGREVWFSNHVLGVFNEAREMEGVWGGQVDITERKQMELALFKSQQLQQAILEALPDMKFRIGADGVFLSYLSPGADDSSLIMEAKDFVGKHIKDVLPDYLQKALMKNIKKALSKQQVRTLEYPLSVNGRLRHYEARISPVDRNEVIAVVREITALKQAQQALQKKLEELDRNNEMLIRYANSNLQLEHFAHTVSHDLREPVRTMASFAQLLKRRYHDLMDEKGKSYLTFIEDSAAHMNQLIEDLLMFARLTNEEEQGFERVDIGKLLDTLQRALGGLIKDKKAAIYIMTPMPTVTGNLTKLTQLFQNVMANAIKFHKPGERPKVEIEAHDEGESWRFAVKDYGIGITPDYHGQIFQLFRRLHSKKQYSGSGIGLALCRRIVEQHGGEIWVESEFGEGATFCFTIRKND